ncbi:MAG: ribosomal L7Ae/L30e/S12e/Gadd45 family protein [Clostridiales bacterium]|nr:ribosomal L7Ae/L30e/S12e/Gadd45 family protein [Clostridiales bacterium]
MTEESKNSLLSLLGLARRAGKLAMGRTRAKAALHSKSAEMILLASDISGALQREINYLAANEKTPVYTPGFSINEIYYACAFKSGVIAVTDKNFAAKILSLVK